MTAKLLRIPVLCMVGIVLCIIPHFISSPSKLIYDVEKSPIFSTATSVSYYYVSMITLGCCIPMLFEYIMDILFLSFGTDKRLRYLSRGLLIFILVVPEMILYFYIIPAKHVEFFGSIFTVRAVVCICIAFYEIDTNRGNVISPMHCHLTVIIIIFSLMIRSFASVISSPIIELIQTIISMIALFSVLALTILWFRKLLGKKFGDLDGSQLSCSIYISIVLFMVFLIIISRYLFGPVNNNSSIQCLVANKMLQVIFVVILSVSHSRIVRNEIIQTQKKLETKRLFVRLVSHEIRTPLNIVVMGLKFIDQELRNSNNGNNSSSTNMLTMNKRESFNGRDMELLSTLKEIQASCDVAVEILNDLLAYEKLEAGIMTLEAKEIQIWSFIKETLRPFSVSAIEHSIRLHFSCDAITETKLRSTVLYGDKSKLSQVLRNIMSNAVKFTPVGGSVTVCLSFIEEDTNTVSNANSKFSLCYPFSSSTSSTICVDRCRLRVDVRDTGYGISKENLPKLFKDIVQFDANELQNGGGSGIGLWVSKSIMDLHDGSLYASSDGIGHGSTFTIELPIFKSTEKTSDIIDIKCPNDDNEEVVEDEVVLQQQQSEETNMPSPRLWNTSFKSSSCIYDQKCDDDNNIDINDDYIDNDNNVVDNDNIHDNIIKNRYISNTANIIDDKPVTNDNVKSTPEIRLPIAFMVDDSAMSIKMTKRMIKHRFSSIQEASDGAMAVEFMKTAMRDGNIVIDVIFMDYQMPIMNGPIATSKIREMGYTGLIIGLTGNALPEDISYFMNQGADVVLTKPLDLNTLDRVLLPVSCI